MTRVPELVVYETYHFAYQQPHKLNMDGYAYDKWKEHIYQHSGYPLWNREQCYYVHETVPAPLGGDQLKITVFGEASFAV